MPVLLDDHALAEEDLGAHEGRNTAPGQLMADKPPPGSFWLKVPVDHEFGRWLTVGFQRQVLVVVRTVTALTRLLDVLSLFDDDHRVQTVFTFDERNSAILSAGVSGFLRDLGVAVLAWEQASSTRFDLAIAASENDDLHLLRAPTVLVPHGIGYQKYYPGSEVVAGMAPDRLVRAGRVVPSVIALSHPGQRDRLEEIGPEAAARAVVVGDPCLDRLLAGRHRAEEYRAAFGARDRTLVVLVSTWGPDSLLGACPELPLRLVSELAYDEVGVCAVLHPGITSAHSPWQIGKWLSQARQAGLCVVPPESGWQAAITAASCVISDEGSLALYAAAQDRPLLLAGGRPDSTVPGSPMAALAARTPRLALDMPLAPQIDLAIQRHVPGEHDTVVKQAVAVPGQSAGLLRRLLYDVMDLPEPAGEAEFAAHRVPDHAPAEIVAFVIGARRREGATELVRYPSTTIAHALDHQHLAAHATQAGLRQLSAAAIVFTDLASEDTDRFSTWARDTLRRWPDARVAAARMPGGVCLSRTRAGTEYELALSSRRADPLLAASLVYLGWTAPTERIIAGNRMLEVALRSR